MKTSSKSGRKLVTVGVHGTVSRRQAYFKGKYKREIFYIGLSLILFIIVAGLGV